jgi:hypothetical protein
MQVETEVKLLLDQLRMVATDAPFQGSAVRSRDPDAVLPKSSSKDKAILNYVAASMVSNSSSSSAILLGREYTYILQILADAIIFFTSR